MISVGFNYGRELPVDVISLIAAAKSNKNHELYHTNYFICKCAFSIDFK